MTAKNYHKLCLSRMCLGDSEMGLMKEVAKPAVSYLCPVAEDLPISSISDKLLGKLRKTI